MLSAQWATDSTQTQAYDHFYENEDFMHATTINQNKYVDKLLSILHCFEKGDLLN